MRFLVDAQLPPALARMLEARGHEAEHVVDITRGDAPDRELWNYAVEHGAVLVTKDEDFSDRVLLLEPAPVVVSGSETRDGAHCSAGSTRWSTRSWRWSKRGAGSSS
ncbi:MAG: DUF5615 family PIN-like protein [Solirubrobacteraceae bacterium]|nr:DUF5615 family PIN-like protein [Solirubrobacteraceae bacterium]